MIMKFSPLGLSFGEFWEVCAKLGSMCDHNFTQVLRPSCSKVKPMEFIGMGDDNNVPCGVIAGPIAGDATIRDWKAGRNSDKDIVFVIIRQEWC